MNSKPVNYYEMQRSDICNNQGKKTKYTSMKHGEEKTTSKKPRTEFQIDQTY